MQIKFISFLIVITCVVIFASQNNAVVPVKFFKYQIESVPVYVIMLVSLLFGTLIMAFFELLSYISLKMEIAKKNNEIKKLKEALKENEEESQNPF